MFTGLFSGAAGRRARGASLGLALVVALALSACGGSAATTTSTATPSPTASSSATTPATTATATLPTTPVPGGYAVVVYFSRHPDSDNTPTAVFALARVSPTLGVATYAMRQLLAGPTSAEQSAGYYTPWTGALTGSSNCGGPDFTITLDHRGATPDPGVATLQFCRQTQIAGELAGARMTATADATLRQFTNIQRVVILNVAGDCFADLKGTNDCLAA